MSREELLVFVLLGFVVLLGLMALGWMLRKRRQASIPELPAVPADPGELIERVEGFYVSTTPDGEPLNRIAARGLGFRSRVTIDVTSTGIVLTMPTLAFFVPAADLREVTRARYTIDRVVEEGGLLLLAWTLGAGTAAAIDLDSYFRVDATQRLVDTIAPLVPPAGASTVLTPDESEKP